MEGRRPEDATPGIWRQPCGDLLRTPHGSLRSGGRLDRCLPHLSFDELILPNTTIQT
jgi:hypothetical protein